LTAEARGGSAEEREGLLDFGKVECPESHAQLSGVL